MKTINIKGKEYITVNERLKAFRNEFKDYALIGRIIEQTPDSVIFEAQIIDDKGIVRANGFARETTQKGGVNKFAMLENAETSAWGRALGNFGIGIDEAICSADELTSKQASDKLSQYHIGEPYSINGKIVGIISAMTIVEDKVYVQVTALDDLCNGVNWYEACEKAENLTNGFRLPTKLDICLWSANAEKINSALEKYGAPFQEDSYYWSSSEYDRYRAWVFCTVAGASRGGVDYYLKILNTSYAVVRPVLAFTL